MMDQMAVTRAENLALIVVLLPAMTRVEFRLLAGSVTR